MSQEKVSWCICRRDAICNEVMSHVKDTCRRSHPLSCMVQGVGRREILYVFENLGLGFRVWAFTGFEIRCVCGAGSRQKRDPLRVRGFGFRIWVLGVNRG